MSTHTQYELRLENTNKQLKERNAHLKLINTKLVEALELAIFYVKGYIYLESGHGNDVSLMSLHLTQIQEAIKGGKK